MGLSSKRNVHDCLSSERESSGLSLGKMVWEEFPSPLIIGLQSIIQNYICVTAHFIGKDSNLHKKKTVSFGRLSIMERMLKVEKYYEEHISSSFDA